MQNENVSFVFFGSGPVASASLQFLTRHFTVEAVVTKSTTKTEMQLICPHVPVYTSDTKQELDVLFTPKSFKSRLGILIDFGIIVSTKIISNFPLGIINSHFSLLPELRGPDPISFAILEGRDTTGVSLMLLVEAMDEGPLLAEQAIAIPAGTTTPILTTSLIELSNTLLQNTLPDYLAGAVTPTSQADIMQQTGRIPSYTRKLTKADGIIDWSKPAELIEREIRAFAGWPKSMTTFKDLPVLIEQAAVVQTEVAESPGEYRIQEKTLTVQCGEHALQIDRLKPAGKKSMDIAAFLAGYKTRLQ